MKQAIAAGRPTLLTSLLACAFLLVCLPLAGAAAQTAASLTASFTPEVAGGRTTLNFAFAFSAPAGEVPPPLTEIELRYPGELGIALSGLGLRDCDASTLEASGPSGCPPNSVMGYGEAVTGIVLGTTIISERALITVLRAPDEEGHIAVLFYAEGSTPVDTHIVFPGVLLAAHPPFGGLVSIGVPLVPTLPGAPYISVIDMRATVGPRGVTYYEHLGGLTLAYRPLGILLPKRCPRAGLQFAAEFTFQDGSRASAHTSAPCPRLGRDARRRRGRRRLRRAGAAPPTAG